MLAFVRRSSATTHNWVQLATISFHRWPLPVTDVYEYSIGANRRKSSPIGFVVEISIGGNRRKFHAIEGRSHYCVAMKMPHKKLRGHLARTWFTPVRILPSRGHSVGTSPNRLNNRRRPTTFPVTCSRWQLRVPRTHFSRFVVMYPFQNSEKYLLEDTDSRVRTKFHIWWFS